jgi:hypothetical protein
MNTPQSLDLRGLDGANPLHLLASLGCLVISDALEPEDAALSWRFDDGRYVPTLHTRRDAGDWCSDIARWLQAEAAGRDAATESGGGPKLRDLKAEEKKLNEERKKARTAAQKEAKQRGLRGPEGREYIAHGLREIDATIAEANARREAAERERAAELGFGFAHLGDIVAVPTAVFRMHVQRALATGNRPLARHLTALASDGCVEDGKVVPTPYSYGNGSSGQYLLKDWRNLAQATTPDLIHKTVVEPGTERKNETSLNWDPEDLRQAALRWSDPAGSRKETNVAANALAYIGLGLLTAVPTAQGLDAVAFDQGFTWPLWEPPLTLDIVAALLATAYCAAPAERLARGILTIRQSKKINPTGKRNYFAPSVPHDR